ncbi:PDC sensor domain-containing protein, partial [Pseudomonas syringae group genomosp. 7]|uniref:PDC sensor domain-containing protein n=1 Tax=Pseudomonas syringae group genomosp. 7 TaxID=251699 RepID=UPI0037702C27
TFMSIYQRKPDGSLDTQPPDDITADNEPRTPPWNVKAIPAGKTILTEPSLDAGTKGLIVPHATPYIAKSVESPGVMVDLSLH